MSDQPTPFFITGLPRSRTAWFANLLTWGDVICHHDPVDLVGHTLGDFAANVINNLRGSFTPVGLSDASTLYAWREYATAFPDAKWVLIDRDARDVIRSMQQVIPDFNGEAIFDLTSDMRAIKQTLNPLVVPFNDITPECCVEVARHLGIDIGPATRIRMLCDFNVQIHPSVFQQRLAAFKQRVADILPKEAA